MSNSLKTTFFVHCASVDYKGVLSLIERRYKVWLVSRWLKKAKKRKVLLKKGLSIRVRFFFDSELPYETRTSLSIALHSTFTNSKFILFIEIWINVFVKNSLILVWRKLKKDLSLKKIVLKVNNHAKDPIVHTKLQSSITPRKKTKFKKIFLLLNSTLDQLFNDTTHISLRRIYRSAKIHWTKKNPFEYIVPSPTSGVGTIMVNWKYVSYSIGSRLITNGSSF